MAAKEVVAQPATVVEEAQEALHAVVELVQRCPALPQAQEPAGLAMHAPPQAIGLEAPDQAMLKTFSVQEEIVPQHPMVAPALTTDLARANGPALTTDPVQASVPVQAIDPEQATFLVPKIDLVRATGPVPRTIDPMSVTDAQGARLRRNSMTSSVTTRDQFGAITIVLGTKIV